MAAEPTTEMWAALAEVPPEPRAQSPPPVQVHRPVVHVRPSSGSGRDVAAPSSNSTKRDAPLPAAQAEGQPPLSPTPVPRDEASPEELAAAQNAERMRFCALAGDTSTVELLLRGSAVGKNPRPPVPPDGPTPDGYTPLMYACLGGSAATAAVLIQHGASVTAQNLWRDTPLTLSGGVGNVDCLELLLASRADVNHVNRAGWGALHRVAMHSHSRAAVALLLRCGARPELRDKGGRTAIELVSDTGDNVVREAIVKAMLRAVRAPLESKLRKDFFSPTVSRRRSAGARRPASASGDINLVGGPGESAGLGLPIAPSSPSIVGHHTSGPTLQMSPTISPSHRTAHRRLGSASPLGRPSAIDFELRQGG